ncbi:MAG: hypothetical protein JWN14_1375 [Chthonomonadales bacterium]|nr:hypothetical protein [Chthonomonadales bacterium]
MGNFGLWGVRQTNQAGWEHQTYQARQANGF